MDDDVARNAADCGARERILLAQAIGIGERHPRRNLGAKPVPVMDRRRDHRPGPVLDGPPALSIG